MRQRIVTTGLILLLGTAAGLATAKPGDDKEAGKDTPTTKPAKDRRAPVLCPVTDQPVQRDICEHFRGRWVYFATDEARKKFLENPYEYADGVRQQWDADHALRLQVKCPVTGEPVEPGIYVGRGEDAIYFATEDARDKWLLSSKPYERRLAEECYTFQTVCPVSGAAIDPQVFREVGARTIYFKCEHCRGEFDTDKTTYLRRFLEQTRENKLAWQKQQQEQRRAEIKRKQEELRRKLAEARRKSDRQDTPPEQPQDEPEPDPE